MKILDALLMEGTSKCAILCYGIVPAARLQKASESLRLLGSSVISRVYDLADDTWPNGIVLVESHVEQVHDVPAAVLDVMRQMDAVSPIASVCMYDAAFGRYEDIFAIRPHLRLMPSAFLEVNL